MKNLKLANSIFLMAKFVKGLREFGFARAFGLTRHDKPARNPPLYTN
jgi:hypothetical protein